MPLFKAQTDIGLLTEIIERLGSPDEALYQRILNPTGQTGLGLSFKKTDPKPLEELLPKAEEDALDLLRYSILTKKNIKKMHKAEVIVLFQFMECIPIFRNANLRIRKIQKAEDALDLLRYAY